MPRTATRKQVRYLLSDVSPLTPEQKKRFKRELHARKVKIQRKKAKKRK